MAQQLKVLVAGVEEVALTHLTGALAALGWEVILARDAISATAVVLRNRPHGVVLHGQLPAGGGVLVLRRLRASVHTAMIPVLAITGRREGDTEELLLHGADKCLPAPADPVAITAWLKERLSTPPVVLEAPRSLIADPERLAALGRTTLLDSPPDESFDALTGLARSLLGVPVALVSLVDENRQFFMSQVGLPEPWASARETPLTHSFCQWVVSEHEVLVVSDARDHPVLSSNRALFDLGVIAYAGVPLTGTSGEPIGSFCAIDAKPREWLEEDVALLRKLSRVAEACIAIAETQSWTSPDTETTGVARSLVMRAVGEGISVTTDVLRQHNPSLGESDRMALLKLIRWFGQHVVQLASG